MHLVDRTNVYNAAGEWKRVDEIPDGREKNDNNARKNRAKRCEKTTGSAFIKMTSSVFEDDSGASTRLTTRMKMDEGCV